MTTPNENDILQQPIAEQNTAEIIAETPIESVTAISDTINVPQTDEQEQEEESTEDYSQYQKDDFLKLIKGLESAKDFTHTNNILKEIKPLFDEIVNAEKELALQKFIGEGGEKDDFKYKNDKIDKEFYFLFGEIQKKRAKHYAEVEEQREKNLQQKRAILDKIRELVDGEETEESIKRLKDLQNTFRQIGGVPNQSSKEIAENYKALLDRFYNNHGLYNELKELDRKKNYEAKVLICEKAENLVHYESVKKAIKELNDMHVEYKLIGPVPKENQEDLWNRFKIASDKVYDRKREVLKIQDEEKIQNLAKKDALYEQILPFATYHSEKIVDWNTKTKELLDIQKQWEEIRFIPREAIKDSSNKFWKAFKGFFNNKNIFIRNLDEAREQNLVKKNALCEEAEAVINSNGERKEIAEKLKELQRRWKDVGAVPQKFQESIYVRFKEICDGFFQKIREEFNTQEQEYEINLKAKRALCDNIEQTTLDDVQIAEATIQNFSREWKAIGFVPRKQKDTIQSRYDQAIAGFITRLNIPQEEKDKLQIGNDLDMASESVNSARKIRDRGNDLRRKIQRLENDTDVLKNNMGFLANSSKADKLKQEVQSQIQESEAKLKVLRSQLKTLQVIEQSLPKEERNYDNNDRNYDRNDNRNNNRRRK